ncbi:MAG: hypothetical protein LC800_14535 [Acidobacteria bacterium]|nr:hypothetical protein [Acidobacteriota bacterium]
MSDYLWDKTGEADDETKRLEELLGGLKFRPRPLELPALPARPFRAARTRTLPSWPRLAVAASLTLAVLAGTWLMFRQQRLATSETQQLAGQQTTDAGGSVKEPAVVETKDDGAGKPKVEAPANTPSAGDSAAARQRVRRPDLANNAGRKLPRAGRAEVVASAARRTAGAAAFEGVSGEVRNYQPNIWRQNRRTPKSDPVRREEIARQYTDEERAAAEKVMYALRLTSEKLAYARRQVQEAGRRDANR